ncbi:MAG: DsbA family protein [Rhodospirillales bacterium]|jgi:protein-disulfide isomerase|nr:DsbA family protein [Rhodospirillales bacterium]
MSYIIGAIVVVGALWFGAKEWPGEDRSPLVATEQPAPGVEAAKEPQVARRTPAEEQGPLGAMLARRVMGSADAPVTMEEFSSLTCPHCATFHREALPKIKKAYIDTGKVKLIYNDFLTRPVALALAAAMLARCGKPERYFGFLEILFRGQQSWATSKDPRKELERVARFGGIGKAEFDACLNNEALLKGIQERVGEAQTRFGIESTPTFLIDGVKVTGPLPFEDFQTVIEEALKSKK